MVEHDPDADLLARRIKEAEEDIGPENLAKFRSLLPAVQAALLLVAREPTMRKRSGGGRPRGSGRDHSEALRKMAALRVDNPRVSARLAAAQIGKAVSVSSERLRHLYGPQKKVLEAEELARRKTPPAAPSILRPAPQPSPPAYSFRAADSTVLGLELARLFNEQVERLTAAGAANAGLPIAAPGQKMTATWLAEQIAAASALSGLEGALLTASKKTTDLLSDLVRESQVGQKLVADFLTQGDWVSNQLLTYLGGSKMPPKK